VEYKIFNPEEITLDNKEAVETLLSLNKIFKSMIISLVKSAHRIMNLDEDTPVMFSNNNNPDNYILHLAVNESGIKVTVIPANKIQH
jgi:hypothetical protein